MPIGQQDIQSILPVLMPEMDNLVVMLVELKDHLWASHEKGTDHKMNSLGARVSLRNKVNTHWGNQSVDGGAFREPGSNDYLQAIITFAAHNISGGATGAAIQNLESPKAFGDSMEQMIALAMEVHKREMDIDFCHGSAPLGFRAKIASITSAASTGSVVVMDSEEGNRFLAENEYYVACDPTTGATHGVAGGHPLLSTSDSVTCTFGGDVTTNTDWAAADILVHKASADGENSFNRAIFGFEYFGLDSGEYFGLSKDTTTKLRGLRENANFNNVSQSLLLRGETRYKYRWNTGDQSELEAMIDAVPTAQYSAYKAMGYSLTNYLQTPGNQISKFDGAIRSISDGNRALVEDANIRPTNWFRYNKDIIKRYVFEETALWTRDGLKWRSIYSSGVSASGGVAATPGQIKDLLSWVIQGKDQMFCNNPAKMITYINLGTIGQFTGV